MTTILHIDSSAKKEGSVTRKLTSEAMQKLKAKYPKTKVIYRDLTEDPLEHINADFVKGAYVGGEFAAHPAIKLSNQLIEELMAADILLIGAPMYNFNIPSQLKAWIDYICRVGLTFRYSEKGPIGLVQNKRCLVAVSHGGLYSEGHMTAFDHVSPYLKQVFGFLGITDITIVRAEKQGMNPDSAQESLKKAEKELDTFILDLN